LTTLTVFLSLYPTRISFNKIESSFAVNMRVIFPKNRKYWMSHCWKAIERYPRGSTFEVKRDGRWHWHPQKEIKIDDKTYMIIYFRNEGESETIEVNELFQIKLGRYAEMYFSARDSMREPGEREPVAVEELAPVKCRFIICQPKVGYCMPSKSSRFEPGTPEHANEAQAPGRETHIYIPESWLERGS
jgi:hypothetical protein